MLLNVNRLRGPVQTRDLKMRAKADDQGVIGITNDDKVKTVCVNIAVVDTAISSSYSTRRTPRLQIWSVTKGSVRAEVRMVLRKITVLRLDNHSFPITESGINPNIFPPQPFVPFENNSCRQLCIPSVPRRVCHLDGRVGYFFVLTSVLCTIQRTLLHIRDIHEMYFQIIYS